MKIILGIFAESFYKLKQQYNLNDYGSFRYDFKASNLDYDETDHIADHKVVLAHVCKACIECEEIYFDVTNINFNFNKPPHWVITLSELHLVLTRPDFFKKTTFFHDGDIINKVLLQEQYLKLSCWENENINS